MLNISNILLHIKICNKVIWVALTLSGPGGRNIAPQTFGRQALQQKLEKPVTWIFLIIPKYVYTLTPKK